MTYKYDNEMKEIQNCPPGSLQKMNQQAFRFVFNEISDNRNFLPVAIQNPKREIKGDISRCKSYALSLFDKKDKALNRFEKLTHRHPNIHKSIGTHLAAGQLTSSDGFATLPEDNGHFSFFEDEGSDLESKFKITQAIYND